MAVPKYLNPSSTQTLRDAIAELQDRESTEDAADHIASELFSDIEIHDVIHVLFGCNTDLGSEVMAHIWTVFGTTYSMRDMARVNAHQDHRRVLSGIGHFRVLKMWIRRLPAIAQTFFRAQQMTRRFPAQDYAQYLDQRLIDIREAFGIKLTASSNSPAPQKTGAALRNLHQDNIQPAAPRL